MKILSLRGERKDYDTISKLTEGLNLIEAGIAVLENVVSVE